MPLPIPRAESTFAVMQARSAYHVPIVSPANVPEDASTRFRARFRRVLSDHVRDCGSVEKSFGAAFDESLDEIPLTEEEQGLIYRELLNWTKQSAPLFAAIHRSYSP